MMSDIFTVYAPAKLNLFLNITGRREDGYHELDSLFAFCGLSDAITIHQRRSGLSLRTYREFANAVDCNDQNLVLRAAELIQKEGNIARGAWIELGKSIPVAAGLGGGSSDAATTMVILNKVWNLNWEVEKLENLALQLGADVPACIRKMPVYARGIGEQLTPAPAMPFCGILLVNPGVTTPTPTVFKTFKAMNPEIAARTFEPLPDHFNNLASLVDAIKPRGNDLLPAAISVTPAIADVLQALGKLPSVAHVGLSGSGATCFALFETPLQAAIAAGSVSCNHYPEWWSWIGTWLRLDRQ